MGIQQSQPVVVALPPHALQAFCKELLNTLHHHKHHKLINHKP